MPRKKIVTRKRPVKPEEKFYDVYIWTESPLRHPFGQSIQSDQLVLFHLLRADEVTQLVESVRQLEEQIQLVGDDFEHCVHVVETPEYWWDELYNKAVWQGAGGPSSSHLRPYFAGIGA